jgi:hypothetical protein
MNNEFDTKDLRKTLAVESSYGFKKMNSLKVLLFAFAALLMGASCSPTTTLVNTSCPGYKSRDFQRADIEREGIAVMPVLGGAEREQFRRPMGDAIYQHGKDAFGEEKIQPARDVINLLNEHGIADDYSRAIDSYQRSGIIPREMIKEAGEVLGVKYLLYTSLLANSEYGLYSMGQNIQVIEADELYLQAQVWDTHLGDVVWEGKGGYAKFRDSPEDIVDLTAQGLIDVIGNDQFDGPCEAPSRLIEAQQQAIASTYLVGSLVGLLVGIFMIALI